MNFFRVDIARAALTVIAVFFAIIASGSVAARGHGGASGGQHARAQHSGGHPSGKRHFAGSPTVGRRHFGHAHVLGAGIIFGTGPFWFEPGYRFFLPGAAMYIEQHEATYAPPDPNAFWYYCAELGSYYPYINECPEGWQRILAQPPS